jgi:hypothetical protein
MKGKVIIYMPTPMPGGALNSSLLLSKGLKEKGYEVLFLANRKGIELGEEVIYLNANDFTRPFKLKKIIVRERPLAVFSNMFTQNISLSLAKMLIPEEIRRDIKFIGISRNAVSRKRRGQTYKLPYRLINQKAIRKPRLRGSGLYRSEKGSSGSFLPQRG